jgi:hypothetical protein
MESGFLLLVGESQDSLDNSGHEQIAGVEETALRPLGNGESMIKDLQLLENVVDSRRIPLHVVDETDARVAYPRLATEFAHILLQFFCRMLRSTFSLHH